MKAEPPSKRDTAGTACNGSSHAAVGNHAPLLTAHKDFPEEIMILDEYKTVLSLVQSSQPVVFVTGNAGTGKSTLIHYLRNVVDKETAVLAPTGVAALNVSGATIHSFFSFPPRVLDEDDIKQVRDRRLYRRLELLIIDEVSMVRCDLMDAMDRFLQRNRGNSEPFGGVQLLLVGDLFQLPPVVPRNVSQVLQARGYDSPYFFSAFVLQRTSLVSVELTSTYRQQDPLFISLLNQLRVGEERENVINELNRHCRQPSGNADVITLTCTNSQADAINREQMACLATPEYTFTGIVQGCFALEQDRLPAPLELRLKQNARVMFTRNDEQRRWVNGSMGIVREVSPSGMLIEVTGGYAGTYGQTYGVVPVTWETYRYAYDETADRIVADPVGRYTQYPVMPAWAVTIHKSQGKTMDNVLVDLGTGAFASGQSYVALSRCRTLEGISLARPIKTSDIIGDPAVRQFYNTINRPAS